MREYIAVVAWGGNISTFNLTVGVFVYEPLVDLFIF
jgi:hypothetical protein